MQTFAAFFLLTLSPMANHMEQKRAYIPLVQQMMDATAHKLQEKYGLELIGQGGSMMSDVEVVGLSFKYTKKVDIPTARKLIVAAVKEQLEDANDNKILRPYLHNYPFTPSNVEIHIFIQPSSEELPYGEISYIQASNGTIRYATYKTQYKREFLLVESYEEALKLEGK